LKPHRFAVEPGGQSRNALPGTARNPENGALVAPGCPWLICSDANAITVDSPPLITGSLSGRDVRLCEANHNFCVWIVRLPA
jgi:hypothetical protein